MKFNNFNFYILNNNFFINKDFNYFNFNYIYKFKNIKNIKLNVILNSFFKENITNSNNKNLYNHYLNLNFFFKLNEQILPLKYDVFILNNQIFIKLNNLYLNFINYNSFLNNLKTINFLMILHTKYISSILYKKLNIIDRVFNFITFNIFNNIIFNKINYRTFFRIKQTNFNNYKINLNFNLFLNNKYIGLKFLWKMMRYWILSLIISIFIAYYLLYIKLLPISKILVGWLLTIMFFYWLISGFVFFFKKYQYSKFTTVIQRFWKRTYIIFWLIESCVFITFFYLTLNASSEPVYMYDQIKIYKTHLFSWRFFIIKLIPVVFIILFGYYLLLNLKWNLFSKNSLYIFIITLVLVYIFWLEFYQIFHIINFYSNIQWVFDSDEYLWTLDITNRRTRIVNNYVAICLFAKFWHLVFIFIFWVFFVLRINEINRIRYFFLSTNLQNFIILYIMSWLYMYPWFKFVFRKYLDQPYFWFFEQNRYYNFYIVFNDLKLIFYSLYNLIIFNMNFNNYKINTTAFFYWIQSSNQVGYNQYKNHSIRDLIISNIYNY